MPSSCRASTNVLLAAFEAAASGLPVIATDVGAIAEIVNAGGGMFIDRTAASLGDALNHLRPTARHRRDG
jgi:glycosyltransferase involved in cell wall biosynthesis